MTCLWAIRDVQIIATAPFVPTRGPSPLLPPAASMHACGVINRARTSWRVIIKLKSNLFRYLGEQDICKLITNTHLFFTKRFLGKEILRKGTEGRWRRRKAPHGTLHGFEQD